MSPTKQSERCLDNTEGERGITVEDLTGTEITRPGETDLPLCGYGMKLSAFCSYRLGSDYDRKTNSDLRAHLLLNIREKEKSEFVPAARFAVEVIR